MERLLSTFLCWLVGTIGHYFLRIHTAEVTERIEEQALEITKLVCCVVLGLLEGAGAC